MEEQSKNSVSLQVQMQTLLQGILSISSVIYFIGFLVVNARYTAYGITNYQLVHTRYVSAGLNFFLIHFGLATLIAVLLIVLELNGRSVYWLLSFVCVWVMFASVLYLFSASIVSVIIVGMNAGLVILIARQIGVASTETAGEWNEIFGVPGESQIQLRTSLLGIGIAILLSVSSLSWGLSSWPYMSSTLGGGRPSEAVFVFDEKALPIDGIPLLPMQTKAISAQIPVLFEDNDGFVVLVKQKLPGSIAIRLSKSIVKSIIYAPAGLAGKREKIPTVIP